MLCPEPPGAARALAITISVTITIRLTIAAAAAATEAGLGWLAQGGSGHGKARTLKSRDGQTRTSEAETRKIPAQTRKQRDGISLTNNVHARPRPGAAQQAARTGLAGVGHDWQEACAGRPTGRRRASTTPEGPQGTGRGGPDPA